MGRKTSPPSAEEWRFDLMQSDRAYLEEGMDFGDLVELICRHARIVGWRPERYQNARTPNEKTMRQVIFRVYVGSQACDFFFNGRDGIRGRYWQSPEMGDDATATLIAKLSPALSAYAYENKPDRSDAHIPRMSESDVAVSLASPIAKVWPDESKGFPHDQRRLIVPRWIEYQQTYSADPLWRWAPRDRDLEIKGALIDEAQVGFDPKQGRRAVQIHLTGFT